jgi:hypothetical protein
MSGDVREFSMAGNNKLRARLEDIPKAPKPDQLRLLREVQRAHPHSVRLAKPGYRGQVAYTCFVHATGLLWSQKYLAIAGESAQFGGPHAPFYASAAFVRYMIDGGALVEIAPGDAHEGTIVVYFNCTMPKHAGRVSADRSIRSKWGDGGRLFDHDLWDVPVIYGDHVRYYRAITRTESLRTFLAYIRTLPTFDDFVQFYGRKI